MTDALALALSQNEIKHALCLPLGEIVQALFLAFSVKSRILSHTGARRGGQAAAGQRRQGDGHGLQRAEPPAPRLR